MPRKKLTPAEAMALLNALQASDPVLWRRWLILEWRQEGITGIAKEIRAFLHRSLEGLDIDVTDTLFQLRGLVFRLASASAAEAQAAGRAGDRPH